MPAKPAHTPSVETSTGVVFRPIDALIPYANNARTHSAEQVAQIAASIEHFGWTNPVLADERGIVAGHGRVLAARQLYDAGRKIRLPSGAELPPGLVPVIDVTGWSDADRRAYIIADNQLALNAGWDFDLLRVEFEALAELDFGMDLTGFGELAGRRRPFSRRGPTSSSSCQACACGRSASITSSRSGATSA